MPRSQVLAVGTPHCPVLSTGSQRGWCEPGGCGGSWCLGKAFSGASTGQGHHHGGWALRCQVPGGPPWSRPQAGVRWGQLCLHVPCPEPGTRPGQAGGLQVWIGAAISSRPSPLPLAELETGTDHCVLPQEARRRVEGRQDPRRQSLVRSLPGALGDLSTAVCGACTWECGFARAVTARPSAEKAASREGPVAVCWPLT